MTNIILRLIKKKEDLLLLSSSYMKGELKLNISKIARELNVDRKTVKNYLNNKVPKKTRKRKKYLDDYRDLIKQILSDELRTFAK